MSFGDECKKISEKFKQADRIKEEKQQKKKKQEESKK